MCKAARVRRCALRPPIMDRTNPDLVRLAYPASGQRRAMIIRRRHRQTLQSEGRLAIWIIIQKGTDNAKSTSNGAVFRMTRRSFAIAASRTTKSQIAL
ncbi:hypothetical protein PsYK624_125890 [Phanerochaete sordida]|uniref:Uncharacterized protein n=1 Tax=Phanerochaete sordida TaxID=48140 RepID=A0A9P3GI64_9APHY|nr:hypothetical protein PsYK624_125890 [Phanerochaete sordida]